MADLLTPPPDGIYPSREALTAALETHTNQQGYIITIARSTLRPGKERIDYQCGHGGSYRKRVEDPLRQRQGKTRLSRCPFKAVATCPKYLAGSWKLRVVISEHNHTAEDLNAFPEKRLKQAHEEDLLSEIIGLNRSGMPPRDIFSHFNHRNNVTEETRDAPGYLEYP